MRRNGEELAAPLAASTHGSKIQEILLRVLAVIVQLIQILKTSRERRLEMLTFQNPPNNYCKNVVQVMYPNEFLLNMRTLIQKLEFFQQANLLLNLIKYYFFQQWAVCG